MRLTALLRVFPVWLACAGLAAGCATPQATPGGAADLAERREVVQTVAAEAGVVVSDSAAASGVGADVLAGGGNAVDAAVATAFALAVTWPEAGNLGGGGFMLVAGLGAEPMCVDYREKAPAAAAVDMYEPGEDRHHPRHVGVPGTVAGLAMAHEQFGTRPWRDLVLPAVELAEDGFLVDVHLADSLNAVLADDSPRVAELRRVYGKPGGGAWLPGDRLVLPDLARTLRRVADAGPSGFYEGPTAEALAGYMAESGGLITANDLAGYDAKPRPATRFTFRGHDVWGAPPPSSGGATVALALDTLENLNLGETGRFEPATLHLFAESLRRAFHRRALLLGDPDFGPVPTETFTDGALAAELAGTTDPAAATPSEDLEPSIPLADEPMSTTHFSVIDAGGMAVANTYTLEQSWGSRMVAPGTGVVLNNEMGDFNWMPGRTTRGGAIGTPANLIAPGKRMLSSMSPTLVTDPDGDVVIVTGSPGGRTIISTVACVVANRLAFGMSPAQCVQAPRLHHGWFPDRLILEDAPEHRAAAEGLRALGHEVVIGGEQGSAHSIFVTDAGQTIGVADHRRGGAAVAAE